MNNVDTKRKIMEVIKNNPSNFNNILNRKENIELLKWIYSNTPIKIKSDDYNLATRLYWLINDMNDFPKCHKCGRYIGENMNIRYSKGYSKYCNRCSKNTEEAREKRKSTCMKKYGTDNPSKSKIVIDKIKNINLERFGYTSPLKNKDVIDKIRKTNLLKYGNECYQKTKEYKDKVKDTCLRKYGKNNVFEVEEIQKKMKDSLIRKYGVDHNMKSKEVQQTKRNNYIKKYGEDYKHIVFGNHGNIGQNRRSYDYIMNNDDVEPLFTKDFYAENKKNNPNYEFPFKCKHCGETFTSIWDDGHSRACPNCSRIFGTSSVEMEISDFIENDLKQNVQYNDRKLISPFELDILCDDRKIAIEVDGLYWHSENCHKERHYHLLKTELCEEKGFQLIHIFENEWKYNKEIVKSRLKNIFGIYDSTVYGRNTTVKTIDFSTASLFMNENHIQGECQSSVNLGLYHKDELISVMTFGKSRFNKKYEWELLRFCNKLGYHVIGGAGKLLKYFEDNYHPNSLISYADRRWSRGNMYKKLGFTHISNSNPNYWYIDFSTVKLMSRLKCQKHKLRKLLGDKFDEKKSEYINMKENGYGRIFDCGNMVFEKQYNQCVD